MSYSENLLKNAKLDKLKEVFGKQSDLNKSLGNIAKRMHSTSYNDVMTQALGGIGTNINISL